MAVKCYVKRFSAFGRVLVLVTSREKKLTKSSQLEKKCLCQAPKQPSDQIRLALYCLGLFMIVSDI